MVVIVTHTPLPIGIRNLIECLAVFQGVSFHMKGLCLIYIIAFMGTLYVSNTVMAHHHNIQAMLSYHMLIGEYT